MKGIRTPLILMAAMLLTAFAANDIRHDMVKFDRIYIAALALTSQGKTEESRKAVNALQKEWRVFKDRQAALDWLAGPPAQGEGRARSGSAAAQDDDHNTAV